MFTVWNRLFALLCSLCLLAGLLCGCGAVTSVMDSDTDSDSEERTKYITLKQDVILYRRADMNSEQVGTADEGQRLSYSSTKRVDGVKWYKTEEGWFSYTDADLSDESDSTQPDEETEAVKPNALMSGYAREELDLLDNFGNSANVIGKLNPGSYVSVYQVRDLWGKVDSGWVLLDKLYIPGRTGVNSGWCVVAESNVNAYSNPGYDTTRLSGLGSLQRVKFYETIDMSGVSWGYTDSGWICMDDVYVEGTIGSGACTVKVTDKTALNVRIGPGKSYDVVRIIDIRATVEVLHQVDGWGFVGDGWIYMELTEVLEG